VREGGTPRHRIILLPPVEPVRTGNLEKDLQETTQKFTRVFEQMVAQYPEHWLWLHKRWKRQPEHEPPVY
jgi:KDO2-lipid IV(A) lauroyltransferase